MDTVNGCLYADVQRCIEAPPQPEPVPLRGFAPVTSSTVFHFHRYMTVVSTAGATLPATITRGAAWSAFKDVFSSGSWNLRYDPATPDQVDVESGEAFAKFLSGATSTQYADQARGFIAVSILDNAHDFSPQKVRIYRREGDERSLRNITALVKDRIRASLTERFGLDQWEAELRSACGTLPSDTRRKVERYAGLDQSFDRRTLRKAVSYVFKSCDLRINENEGRLVLRGNHNFDAIPKRMYPGSEPAHARSLVYRYAKLMLKKLAGAPSDQTGSSVTLRALREAVDVAVEAGCWGLIDPLMPSVRSSRSLVCPLDLTVEVQGLLDEQDVRIAAGWEKEKS